MLRRHGLLQLLDGSHAMRHVWFVPLKKRQQRERPWHDQQGHLDDAGHGLFVNPCVRHSISRTCLTARSSIVVGAGNNILQHRHNQLFERP